MSHGRNSLHKPSNPLTRIPYNTYTVSLQRVLILADMLLPLFQTSHYKMFMCPIAWVHFGALTAKWNGF